ncbi:MAG: PIN domain protein [Chlamydiae bacterium]|nr:MAG: PIN domain protein [Chlamydiota bacterium]
MKKRIYTDTSVIGGCFDDEFKKGSRALFNMFRSELATIVISNLTLAELENAPEPVQNILKEIPDTSIEYINLTEEAKELANNYLNEKVVSNKFIVDAQHIAIATVNRVDVLVSWNFKHIVNLKRIYSYNSINLKMGYPILEIRNPLEVINYED